MPVSTPGARRHERSPRRRCSPGGVFDVDFDTDSVGCPAGQPRVDPPRPRVGTASFEQACATCQLRTNAPAAAKVVPFGSACTRRPWPGPGSGKPTRLAGRLPRHPTQGGTQARPPDAPPARRTPGPGSAARPGSPPTSVYSPLQSTWPGSACSDSSTPPARNSYVRPGPGGRVADDRLVGHEDRITLASPSTQAPTSRSTTARPTDKDPQQPRP